MRQQKRRRTRRSILRREALQFEFELPTPPRMAYTFAMNTKLLKIASAVYLLAGFHASATQQVKDLLIIQGKHLYTYDTPSPSEAFPKLKIPQFHSVSTANYKGYVATWAVFQEQLYLIGLEGLIEDEELGFPIMHSDEKILKGQVFPLKVEGWSGEVKDVIRGCSTTVEGSNKVTYYDKVSTVVIEKGKVTKVEFDKEVPLEPKTAEESKSEQGGTGQPATRPESKSDGGDKPQSKSEGRSR